jgi:DNA recombination protein RmuC
MTDTLLTIAIVLSGLGVVLLLLLVLRKRADFGPLLNCFENLEKCQERTERGTKEEIARNRQEFAEQSRALREEVQISLKHSTDSLVQSVDHISKAQQQRLEDFAAQLGSLKQITDLTAGQQRQELSGTLKDFKDSLQRQMHEIAGLQKQQFDSFAADLARLTDTNQKKSDELRLTVEARLKELQTDNATKLEEMRRTVDEKLQGALEKRLGESFKLVSERLEQVHKGLGEMQSLASGVGDLKRVLTNVKARGTWGEMQLGNLLEQVLTTDQYARNVRPKPGSLETVEFAIKLPGREEDERSVVWLPIDAKFPKEDYERLVDATERSDAIAVEQAGKELEMRIRNQARNIRDK